MSKGSFLPTNSGGLWGLSFNYGFVTGNYGAENPKVGTEMGAATPPIIDYAANFSCNKVLSCYKAAILSYN